MSGIARPRYRNRVDAFRRRARNARCGPGAEAMAPPRGRSLSAQSDNNVATTHWGPRAVGGGDREWGKPRSKALRPSWSGDVRLSWYPSRRAPRAGGKASVPGYLAPVGLPARLPFDLPLLGLKACSPLRAFATATAVSQQRHRPAAFAAQLHTCTLRCVSSCKRAPPRFRHPSSRISRPAPKEQHRDCSTRGAP